MLPKQRPRGNRHVPEEVVVTRGPNERSKQGTLGTRLTLTTNYFRLKRKEQLAVFQYHVQMEPPVEDQRQRMALINTQAPVIGPYIFDGTQLFLYNKLGSDEVELQVRDPRGTDMLYKVCIRRAGMVTMTSEKALQLLNLMQRQAMASLKLKLINHNFYDPAEKISVPQFGLEVYPGYATSIRQHEHDLLLGVQITHRVQRTDTVYQLYQKLAARDETAGDREAFKRAVVGSVVMTIYNEKTYLVSDVDFNLTPTGSFTRKDGSTITYADYLFQAYNVRIRDMKQPMLLSVRNKRQRGRGQHDLLALVPELCRLTGLSNEMRRNHRLMAAIASHTRLSADKRIERLERFNARLLGAPQSSEVFQHWRTELDRRLMEVPARVLAPENIFLASSGRSVPAGTKADWTAAFRNNGLYKTVSLKYWCAICPEADGEDLRVFLTCLIAVGEKMGFLITQPWIAPVVGSMDEYMDVLRVHINRTPQLILCVVPGDHADRYGMVKKMCCVDRAIPTQVLRARTIKPRGRPGDGTGHLRCVATKLAIQLTCKLGGIPWLVKNPLSCVMVVGFDVCHDTSNAGRSYGALVATMYGVQGDPEPRFFSCVEPHDAGTEVSSFIAAGIEKALRAYQQHFGSDQVPRRIFFFRDGVSDGQLGYVVKLEVTAMRERLHEIAPGRIQLTFFVVTKRINTRLFHGAENPPPGTIVDDAITLPERTDFYLVSQSVRNGTVSPTAYNIIRDESGLTVDQLQAYTAKQTHLYYNWTGTVSVPAVCQYAHKLAGLVGQYLHETPNQNLDDQLYFL